jgi:hypothetical protein
MGLLLAYVLAAIKLDITNDEEVLDILLTLRLDLQIDEFLEILFLLLIEVEDGLLVK